MSIDCHESLSPGTGLRARKQARTRQALAGVALRLFATRGYEQTTIEEIAAAAEISPRTFFRYFASKDELLFSLRSKEKPLFFLSDEHFQAVIDAALAAAGERSDLDAVCLGLQTLAPELEELREGLGLLAAATASSPILRGRSLDASKELESRVAAAVARRRGEAAVSDVSATVAAVAMTLFRLALDRWLAAAEPPPLGDVIGTEFARLHRLAGAAPPTPGP